VFCERFPEVLRADLLYHYIVRWTRQVLRSDGVVRVVRQGESLGLGLRYYGPRFQLRKGQAILPDFIDGLLVPIPRRIGADVRSSVFSRYSDGRNHFIIVGPLALCNDDPTSVLGLKVARKAEHSTQLQLDAAKENPVDRVWTLETANIFCRRVFCINFLGKAVTVNCRDPIMFAYSGTVPCQAE